eukprot:scaffold1318_cov388-Prasinococcus_capsulatus_cf.AAC.44
MAHLLVELRLRGLLGENRVDREDPLPLVRRARPAHVARRPIHRQQHLAGGSAARQRALVPSWRQDTQGPAPG